MTFIDQQHPELPLAEPHAAVPRNFFPSRTRVKLIEGYSDPKDTRASRPGRTAANSVANKPHRHHSGAGGGVGVGAATTVSGQVSKGDFRNYSNLTAPVPKTRNKSRGGGGAGNGEKGATKRNTRRKVSDSGECTNYFFSTGPTVFLLFMVYRHPQFQWSATETRRLSNAEAIIKNAGLLLAVVVGRTLFCPALKCNMDLSALSLVHAKHN